MVLAFDIGNTRTKVAAYQDGRRIWTDIIEPPGDLVSCLYNHPDADIIFCTTSVLTDADRDALRLRGALELTHRTTLPFQNRYQTPHTLGRDRMAAVAGAQSEFPGRAVLVIDAGTCITYEFLDAEGTYLGGNISPGLRMRARAMHRQTAKLPEARIEFRENFIGGNTNEALANGVVRGVLLEIEGTIDRFLRDFGDGAIVLTGGDSDFLKIHLRKTIFARPKLVLDGLYAIWQHRQSTSNKN